MDASKLEAFAKAYHVPSEGIVFDDQGLQNFLQQACDSCMPRRKNGQTNRKPVHWWSSEIASLRKLSLQARRKYQKIRKRLGPELCVVEHRAAREASKALRLEIRRSQEKCWRLLCKEVDNDPWGLPYRIVTKKLIGRRSIPGLTLPGRLDAIVNWLFPRCPPPQYTPVDSQVTVSDTFAVEDLKQAGLNLPRGKAPGPDGVPDEVLRVIVKVRPELLLPTFIACLRTGQFLESWKTAKLVLLRKGNKPLEEPSSYRPLCLLNSVGKLYERLIKVKIESHLYAQPDGLSRLQFGFVKSRSTTQAVSHVMKIVEKAGTGQLYNRRLCALASLDVANAFNSAPWDHIDAALIEKRVPGYLIAGIRSYFDGRSVQTDAGTREVTAGVPQGSVIGPLLWNIFYDSLLRMEYPEGVQVVCFADDAAIVATGKTTWILESAMNSALDMVADWMDVHQLTISSSKSAAVMLTTKRGYVKPVFKYKGTNIELKDSIRYLGIELSCVLGFRKHIEVTSDKATKTASALARLMPNVGGPMPVKRKLLTSVVHSQLLYAAPIWHSALLYDRNKKTLASPQRKMALRVISAYCTVSNEAAMVVAGIVPIHILALERALMERSKSTGILKDVARADANARSMLKWQSEWEAASNGRWTFRLIPNVQQWTERRFGQVSFHMTQALTGHGCFNAYLCRFKKRDDSVCMYCQHPVDDAEHTVFLCDRWWRQRRELEVMLDGMFTPETMTATMLSSRRRWDAVSKFIETVLTTKEADERAIQAEA